MSQSSIPSTSPSTSPRSGLILFMAIAFGTSWALWAATIVIGGPAVPGTPAFTTYLLGAFGPLFAAAVVRLRRFRSGLPRPAHAVRFRPASLIWSPLLLILAALIVLAGALLAGSAGAADAPSPDSVAGVLKHYPMGAIVFLVNMLIAGPLAEEPGWRGTAYPRMRAAMGNVTASMILGAVWAVWHLPLFFIAGTIQHQLGLASPSGMLFMVSAIPMSMLICAAYERAGVLAAIAVHFATNATLTLLAVSAPAAQALIMGLQALIALVLLARHRAPRPSIRNADAGSAGRLRGVPEPERP